LLKKLLSCLLSILPCILASSAFAAFPPPQGWYVEANSGYSSAGNKSYDVPNVRRTGSGWNFNLGYKLTPFFSAEAGYTHYFPTRLYNGSKIGEDSHYSYDLAGKAILPITDSSAEFFGKLGMARIHSNTKITDPALAAGFNIPEGTKNVNGLYIALGLEYYFAPSMAANIQWARTHGNSETGDMTLMGAGLSYNFG
jgi:hypothetical protein